MNTMDHILLLPNNLLNLLNSTLSLIRSGEEQLLEDFWAANHYCAGESHLLTVTISKKMPCSRQLNENTQRVKTNVLKLMFQARTTSRGTLSCWDKRWPHMRRAPATDSSISHCLPASSNLSPLCSR